jgi:hypothetical protein
MGEGLSMSGVVEGLGRWLGSPRQVMRSVLVPPTRTDLTLPIEAGDEASSLSGYLTLTISEMFLERSGWRLRDYLPLCLVTLDLENDGNRVTRPFVLSYRALGGALSAVLQRDEAVPVEFFDTRIAGPLPFAHRHIGIFVALFRIKRSDQVELLFDLLGEFGVANPLAAQVDVARKIYDGVGRMLGWRDLEFLFGTRQGFVAGDGMGERLQTGFLAVTGAPESELAADELWVRSRRLMDGREPGRLQPFRRYDFCLLAVEHKAGRGTFKDLPFFSERWPKLKPRILVEAPERWAQDWDDILRDAASCPELTDDDRSLAVAALWEMRNKVLASRHGPTNVTRGVTALSGTALLGNAAAQVRQTRGGEPARVQTRLEDEDVDMVAQGLSAGFRKRRRPLPPPQRVLAEIYALERQARS